ARFTTPVARYRTTRPTPDIANTPPSAKPSTRNGLRSGMSGSGHPGLPCRRDVSGLSCGVVSAGVQPVLLLGRANRVERVAGQVRDLEAVLDLDDVAVLRRHGEVGVVGHVRP